jgi:hypothetical protein
MMFRGNCLSLLQGLAVAAQPLSFLQKPTQRESSPLPLHLLDLKHQAGEASYFEWDLCTTQVHSHLGGVGPDAGAEEMRFSEVATGIDLKVVTTSPYLVNENSRNTARGCFGVVNVAKDSNVTLTFTFVNSGTDVPATLESSAYLSFFDLDCSSSGCESVTVGSSQVKNMCLDENTELALENFMSSEQKAMLSLEAGTKGSGSDNPPPLEALQKARAVTFEMNGSTLAATLHVKQSNIGRNFLIGGLSTLCNVKETTTTTTLGGGEQSCSDCIVWGDPHIITFDLNKKRHAQHPMREAFFRTRGWKSDQVSIYDEGTFWLVKNDLVHIQARYWHDKANPEWTNLGALAIGGPFLDNNTLVIRSLGAATTWNDQEILALLPSRFENSLVSAKYHSGSETVKDGKPGPGLDIELPMGVKLVVNRWKQNLAAKITMCHTQGLQTGQCGNFNGNANDDAQEILSAGNKQSVPSHEFLFGDRIISKTLEIAAH